MSMFGEVQIGLLRAESDDEDDEFSTIKEDEDKKHKIFWLNDSYKQQKLMVDELILADGPISSAFLYTYLLNHINGEYTSIGLSATKSEYKVYEVNQIDKFQASSPLNNVRTNFIYYVKNIQGKSYVICQLFSQLKGSEVYDWINQLWSCVEFSSVLVLCSQTNTNYFGSQARFPCVKFISSEKLNNQEVLSKSCGRLDEPNFIGNLPAALINFCVLRTIPFTSFVCYSRSLTVDLPSVKEFYTGISDHLKQRNIFIDNDLSKRTLLQMSKIVSSISALYM